MAEYSKSGAAVLESEDGDDLSSTDFKALETSAFHSHDLSTRESTVEFDAAFGTLGFSESGRLDSTLHEVSASFQSARDLVSRMHEVVENERGSSGSPFPSDLMRLIQHWQNTIEPSLCKALDTCRELGLEGIEKSARTVIMRGLYALVSQPSGVENFNRLGEKIYGKDLWQKFDQLGNAIFKSRSATEARDMLNQDPMLHVMYPEILGRNLKEDLEVLP